MTRKERILAAVRRRAVDRLPFCTYNLYPCAGSLHARDESYRELLDLVWEKAGMLCKTAPKPTSSGIPDDRREGTVEERDGYRIHTTVLRTPKGDLRQVQVTPPGQPSLVTEHFIKTDDDIERYLSLRRESVDYDGTNLFELDRALEGRGVVYAKSHLDPMHTVAQLFDFQDFAVRCVTQPEGLRRLIDAEMELIVEDTRRRLRACEGLEALFYTSGVELATPPMLPPAVFARFVTPYQRRLVQMVHDAGHLCCAHCHGKVGRVLEELIATGLDAIEPIEPPPQGDVTLPELMERCEGRLALIGHIQDQEFYTARPGGMTRRVEESARAAAGRTGYVMCPTATPFQYPVSETYVRNYSEWIEAAARIL